MSERNNNTPFDQGPIFIAKHQKKRYIPNLDKILSKIKPSKMEILKLQTEIDEVNQNRLEANMRVRE